MKLVVSSAIGLALAYLVLLGALLMARPKGHLLGEAFAPATGPPATAAAPGR
jgi:hypothetical protein